MLRSSWSKSISETLINAFEYTACTAPQCGVTAVDYMRDTESGC